MFRAEDGKTAVMLWNDTCSEQSVKIALEGAALNAWVSPNCEGDGVPSTIGPDEIIFVYQK